MSLFGGDSSAPPTESEYESDSDNPIEQTAPVTRLRSPSSAQHAQYTQDDLEVTAENATQDAAGNDADSEESSEEEPERPNRFNGPPQTWKGYTAEDRQIAQSLQQLEDTDIAAHLYNAHVLKRRVRKPASEHSTLKNWQNKDAWLKQGKDLQYTDAAGQLQTELIPAKDWTAWPLPPNSLCTLNDGFRRAAIVPVEDEWVIGGSGSRDAGEELKDEMLGLFLRLAKENWTAKAWQDDELQSARKGEQSRFRSRSRSRSRSQSTRSDVHMKDVSGAESEDGGDKRAQEGGVRRGRKPQIELDIKPTILADDAKAERLLRPTIASMLSELDNVALALQRTRFNHFGRTGFGGGSSQSEFTTDAETTEQESRSRSRSRAKSASKSKPATRQPSRRTSRHASRALTSPERPSRPEVEPVHSDSASDYGAQFGEKDASRSPTIRRKRSRSASTVDEEDATNTRDWSRAGLMDWSEVLGIAAVKGWDQKALARTAQRCAALFGESMSFLPFHEDLALDSVPEPVQYTPSTIPAPGSSVIGVSRPKKRPYFQPGAIRCPHTDCYGHQKDFKVPYRTIEHCMRVHGYDPRSNESDNEERLLGGVHIDGFLQPITAKQGWLGHGRSKAGGKKRKTEDVDLAGPVTTVPGTEEETH